MKLLNFHKTVCVCVSVYVHVCACVCTSVSMSVYPCSATGTSIMQIKCSIIQLHPRPHNSLSPLLMHHSVLAQPLTTKLLCFLSPPPTFMRANEFLLTGYHSTSSNGSQSMTPQPQNLLLEISRYF